VMLKCRVFGGKTGTLPVGQVFRVVRPIATVRNRPGNLDPLLTLVACQEGHNLQVRSLDTGTRNRHAAHDYVGRYTQGSP